MIYTKRQFQEGVTFYTDSFTGNVYDIDIDQDVTELYLSGDKAQHYVIKEVRMYENKKRFPQIERIYIADSVMSIRIPNKMFPNVKEIISDSKSFQSGKLDRYFRFLPFNPDVIWRQYEKINTNERLFRFLILLYPTVENAEIKKDIEKTFKRLQRASVNGLYKKGEFELLVRYLSYNLSTKKILENLVAASERDSKPEIKAYALIALQAYETKTEKTYKL